MKNGCFFNNGEDFNIKYHYETKHACKVGQYQGQSRLDKVTDLKKRLQIQQFLFKKPNVKSELLRLVT